MENNDRHDFDNVNQPNQPIDDGIQENNQNPKLQNEQGIETEYISYRGYHELISSKEDEV
mgnify:CR=1 FL=1